MLKMLNELTVFLLAVLAQVSIISGQSLARYKTVTTSPVSGPGSRAVDGDYNRNINHCADTGPASDNPWITIDLGEEFVFNRIVIYGHTSRNWHTQSFADVEIFFDDVKETTVPRNGSSFINFYHFSFEQPQSATNIKFLSPGRKRLILCEVDIFDDSIISKDIATSASSQFGNWVSSSAVDGSTRRHDPDVCMCCAATRQETNPWLKVDLGASFFITFIQIYGREDKQPQGQSFEGMEISIDNVAVGTIPSNGIFTNYHEAFIIPDKIGQEVKLTLTGQNKLLVVCELIVYGERDRIISVKKTAQMISQYQGWVAQRGVDGNCGTVPSGCQCCSATGYETNPWFEVDFGQVHKVERIVIYGRTDRQYRGQSFGGMTIRLNSTSAKKIPTTEGWIQYFAFDLAATYLAQTITLTLEGSDKQLVVCELLVFGDCMDGVFGKDCTAQCHCEGDPCSTLTGVCPSGICEPGYEGETCSDECNGRFGQNCSLECGNCKNDESCHHITGHCTECADGYRSTDPLCKTACLPGFYGLNCSETCGYCRDDETCDFINGHCTRCANGYKNSDTICKTACNNGTFGENCTQSCGNCRNKEVCNKTSGHCTECKDGYFHTSDPVCKTNCSSGTYGRNCEGRCGACRDGEVCNFVSGICSDCMDGRYITSDKLCQTRCGWGKYGYNCTQSCGNCANNETCQNDNGICNSCTNGYNNSDTFCTTICNPGYYGYNCEERCGTCFGDKICHHMNGSCSRCAESFTGALCAERLVVDEDDPSPIGIIIGVVVPVVIVLVIVLLVFIIIRRRRQPKTENPKHHFEEMNRTLCSNNEAYDNSVPLAKEHVIFPLENGKKDRSIKKLKDTRKGEAVDQERNDDQETYYNFTLGLRIHQLWDYIRNNKPDGFVNEYSKLKDGLQYPVNDAMANRKKNRYREMYPYDHSRVHLDVKREGESEFINASYINGYDGKPKFIASQGPVEAMIDDFWRMIWQKEVGKIVMVTNLMEGGSHKCLQYWPDEGEINFGRIRIKLITDDKFSDYSIKTLQISQDGETPRQVYQYHYKAWPDKDVPDSTWSLTQFWREVFKDGSKNSSVPIVVHCSAGVGRTGTFIALDNLYHQAIDTGSVTPFSIVEKLREQRVKMVQTSDQYIYLHEAVADALLFGTHYIWQSQYPDYYDFMIKKDKQREKIRLKLQFEYAEKSLEDRTSETIDASQPTEDNIYSNEENPPQSSALITTSQMDPVFLPSLNGPNSFLLSKPPTKTSIGECLKLIDEHNIKIVVTINEDTNNSSSAWSALNKQNCPQYSPELVSDKKDRNLVERSFSYSKQSKTKPIQAQIKLLELPLSLSGDPERQAQTVLRLLERINTLHPYISTTEPVMIQCRDGITVSSAVSVLLNEKLRMVKDGGQINILESVMLVRQARKTCIGSYNSFKFIHDMVLQMVEHKQPEYVLEEEQPEEENIYQNT